MMRGRVGLNMMQYLKKIKAKIMQPLWVGMSGTSVPAILVSAGVLGVSAVGITTALNQASKSQNDAAIKASAGKFQDVLRSELAKTIRNYLSDDCTGARYGSTVAPLSRAFKTLTINSVDSVGSASMQYTKSPVSLSTNHKAAAARCASPRNGATDNARIDGGEYIYFCMKFDVDADYLTKDKFSKQSFWKLPESFMEVLVIPVQLQTDTPILCKDVNGAGQGAKVIYSIYYANKVGGGRENATYDGKRIDGLFYVSGEQ